MVCITSALSDRQVSAPHNTCPNNTTHRHAHAQRVENASVVLQGGVANAPARFNDPSIPDSAILANSRANADVKHQWGVFGHPNAHLGGNVNRSANDGTITRFGWKAQNKSLLLFAGEAYNVKIGISKLGVRISRT